jgi:hypothetical protein
MNAALSLEIDSGTTRGSDDDVQRMMSELAIQRDKKYIRWTGDPTAVEGELRSLIRRDNARGKV